MKQHMIMRVHMEADYLIEHQATIREVAEHFGLNRSTVKRDLSDYLADIDEAKYKKVIKVFEKNGRNQCLKASKSKGTGEMRAVIVVCRNTSCRWNNAPHFDAKGYCKRNEIELTNTEVELKGGEWEDITDCRHFQYLNKGEEFRRSRDEA